MSIVLRPGTRKDIGYLTDIADQAWEETIAPLLPKGAAQRARLAHEFEKFLSAHVEACIVAELGSRHAGFVASAGHDNRMTHLWVGPRFQGRGVGEALLSAFEARARAAGHREVELAVLAENTRGRRFFERCGYDAVDVEKTPDPNLGIVVKRFVMRKKV